MTDKTKGTVKWFNDKKGFGFITANEKEYFIHYKGIKCDGFKTLPEGAEVLFKASQGQKGPVAEEVEVV